jgi:hypothetical protein
MWYDVHRDAALAVLGAATGLASLLLVFVGFCLTQADSFPAGTAKAVTRRYIDLARLGLVPVVLCVVAMLTSYSWLFQPDSVIRLKTWSLAFPIATWAFLVYAFWAVFVLWKR